MMMEEFQDLLRKLAQEGKLFIKVADIREGRDVEFSVDNIDVVSGQQQGVSWLVISSNDFLCIPRRMNYIGGETSVLAE
jgi:hypothetical protein